MDPEFKKALIQLLIAAMSGGLVGVFTRRQTERESNRLAEARFTLEQKAKEESLLAERREEERLRIEMYRADLTDCRKQAAENDARALTLSKLYEARIVACRECGYKCITRLQENVDKALKGIASEEPGQDSDH